MKLNFTIRQLLLATIGFSIVIGLLTAMIRGSVYGHALILGMLLLAIPMLGLALVYLAANAAHLVFGPVRRTHRAAASAGLRADRVVKEATSQTATTEPTSTSSIPTVTVASNDVSVSPSSGSQTSDLD